MFWQCGQCCKDASAGDVTEIDDRDENAPNRQESLGNGMYEEKPGFATVQPVNALSNNFDPPPEPVKPASATPVRTADGVDDKKQLQDMVKKWTTKAADVPVRCTVVDKASARRTQGTYQLDASLLAFLVTPTGMSETRYELKDVEGFYSYDGVQASERSSIPALTEQEQPVAILVRTMVSGQSSWLCMLETSEAKKDDFLKCMRILRHFVQSPKKAA